MARHQRIRALAEPRLHLLPRPEAPRIGRQGASEISPNVPCFRSSLMRIRSKRSSGKSLTMCSYCPHTASRPDHVTRASASRIGQARRKKVRRPPVPAQPQATPAAGLLAFFADVHVQLGLLKFGVARNLTSVRNRGCENAGKCSAWFCGEGATV